MKKPLAETHLNKHRLRALRNLLRDQPLTQREISSQLGIYQSQSSELIRTLVSQGQAMIDRKICGQGSKKRIQVYTLTPRYLATLKPRSEPQDLPVTMIEPKPTLWQRFVGWLTGTPATAAQRPARASAA